jgi:hypothetical protein
MSLIKQKQSLKKPNFRKLASHSLYLNQNKSTLTKSLRYSYKFASIISPGSLKDMTLVSRAQLTSTSSDSIYVKQSYILLTWMTYIRETHSRGNQKKKDTSVDSEEDNISTPSFFVYPTKTTKLTYLKAPMAHKTFSQEQFVAKSYSLSISFNNTFREQSTINSVNNSLYVALYLRNTYLPTETNLLFLKKLRMSLTCKDSKYMVA